jgi:hypothetical protein
LRRNVATSVRNIHKEENASIATRRITSQLFVAANQFAENIQEANQSLEEMQEQSK